ncbi:MAG: hypothetical protein KDA28_03055, partial [Phycisphaerales bacterium]|nr:hypothetical protein [Phycisphaerales bacterium]
MPPEPVRPTDIHVEPIALDRIRLVIEPGEPGIDPRTDDVWTRMLASNERLFDAPILAFRGVEGDEVHCAIDAYRNFAVQDEIDLGVTLLAVTGVVTGRSRGV